MELKRVILVKIAGFFVVFIVSGDQVLDSARLKPSFEDAIHSNLELVLSLVYHATATAAIECSFYCCSKESVVVVLPIAIMFQLLASLLLPK